MDQYVQSSSFHDAVHEIANGLFIAIVSARSGSDCRTLGHAASGLGELLQLIHEDLKLELIHLAGFMEEKLEGLSYTTPPSAVDDQIQLGMTTIRNILKSNNS